MDDTSKNVDRLMIRHDDEDAVFELKLENRSTDFQPRVLHGNYLSRIFVN